MVFDAKIVTDAEESIVKSKTLPKIDTVQSSQNSSPSLTQPPTSASQACSDTVSLEEFRGSDAESSGANAAKKLKKKRNQVQKPSNPVAEGATTDTRQSIQKPDCEIQCDVVAIE